MQAYTAIPIILFISAVILIVFDKKLMQLFDVDQKQDNSSTNKK